MEETTGRKHTQIFLYPVALESPGGCCINDLKGCFGLKLSPRCSLVLGEDKWLWIQADLGFCHSHVLC